MEGCVMGKVQCHLDITDRQVVLCLSERDADESPELSSCEIRIAAKSTLAYELPPVRKLRVLTGRLACRLLPVCIMLNDHTARRVHVLHNDVTCAKGEDSKYRCLN